MNANLKFRILEADELIKPNDFFYTIGNFDINRIEFNVSTLVTNDIRSRARFAPANYSIGDTVYDALILMGGSILFRSCVNTITGGFLVKDLLKL